MKRIIRNLLAHWQYAGGLFLLVMVELYCITGISDALYDMKNIGAESSGIQYMVAEALTPDAWQRTGLYMSDSEKEQWNNCYEKEKDGLYHLSDMFKSANSLKELERLFRIPQAIVWKISNMDEGVLTDLLEENGELEKTDYMGVRDMMEEQLEKEADETVNGYAMAFVKKQSEDAGVDLLEIKTRYLSGSVFRVVLYLMILAGAAVGMAYLSEYTLQLMGRWIQEPNLRNAGQMMLYLSCLMFGAVFLYISALCRLGEYHAGKGWYAAGRIFLPVCLSFVWLVRIRPELEGLREKAAFSPGNARRYIKRVRWIAVAGFPAAVLFAGCTAVWSICGSSLLFLILADIILAAGGFLLPDIALEADCVDENFSVMDGEEGGTGR